MTNTLLCGMQQGTLQHTVVEAVAWMCSGTHVTWLPEYGCALLAVNAADSPVLGGQVPSCSFDMQLGELQLFMVWLDKWESKVHRCALPSYACAHLHAR